MDIRLYYEFVVLARTLNYHDAALKLQVSQSTLSRHIVELENFYHLQLFTRDKYHVDLTDEGSVFYDSAMAIWRDFEDSQKVAKSLNAHSNRILVGGVLNTVMFYSSVNKAEERVREKFPSFSLKLSSHTSASIKEQVELLRSGELSCSAVFFANGLSDEYPDIAVERICDIPTELVVSADNPLSERSGQVGIGDLNGFRLLQLVSDQYTPIWKCIRYELDRQGVEYSVAPVSVSSTYDIVGAIQGIASKDVFVTYRGVMDSFIDTYRLSMDGLRVFPIDPASLSLGLDLIYLTGQDTSMLGELVDALRASFGARFGEGAADLDAGSDDAEIDAGGSSLKDATVSLS